LGTLLFISESGSGDPRYSRIGSALGKASNQFRYQELKVLISDLELFFFQFLFFLICLPYLIEYQVSVPVEYSEICKRKKMISLRVSFHFLNF
jgi:hypothetical protein